MRPCLDRAHAADAWRSGGRSRSAASTPHSRGGSRSDRRGKSASDPMAADGADRDPAGMTTEGGPMRGTLVCAVTDGEESEDALALGAELSERLGLRLVLAHAVDGIDGDRPRRRERDDEGQPAGRRAPAGAAGRRARRRRARREARRRRRAGGAARADRRRGGRRRDRRRRPRPRLAEAARERAGRRARDGDAGAGADRAAADAPAAEAAP